MISTASKALVTFFEFVCDKYNAIVVERMFEPSSALWDTSAAFPCQERILGRINFVASLYSLVSFVDLDHSIL
jgi:hypothetical protein